MHQLFIDFKKAYVSIRRQILYNILIKFGIPMKVVTIIKKCLNETNGTICVGKHLSDMFPINPLNTELNPICHLLTLLGAHHIFHVNGLRVKNG